MINNQLVVIRNPIERFVSAVNYALEKWLHSSIIKQLISNNIDTPERWINVWSDPSHKYYNLLMSEMRNNSHYIGKVFPTYKWTYTPQSYWINNPRYIIIMDYFEEEFAYFMKDCKYNMVVKNTTIKNRGNKLSENSIIFLHTIYKDDFEYYKKYSNMRMEDRLS